MAGGSLTHRLRTRAVLLGALATLAPGGSLLGAPAQATLAAATQGPPTSITSSRDGSLIFVGLDRRFSEDGGIVAFRRVAGDRLERRGSATVSLGVRGLAATPDGSAVVFTTRAGPGIVAVAALLTATKTTPTVRPDGALPGSNQIVVSPDGTHAFYTNQRDASLGVALLGRTPEGEPTVTIVAHVPLDRFPGGIALSPDGSLLYVTSEIDSADPERIAEHADPRLGQLACDVNHGPHGVLAVIDARRAVADPANAVRARIAAGCAPVRVSLSPHGDIAWVSARGDDRALGFATARLLDDPERSALAQIDTGPEPIGIVATHDGTHLAIVSSDGEAPRDGKRRANVAIFDVAEGRGSVPVATFAAGSKPRELYESNDGALWITDYAGRAVRAIARP